MPFTFGGSWPNLESSLIQDYYIDPSKSGLYGILSVAPVTSRVGAYFSSDPTRGIRFTAGSSDVWPLDTNRPINSTNRMRVRTFQTDRRTNSETVDASATQSLDGQFPVVSSIANIMMQRTMVSKALRLEESITTGLNATAGADGFIASAQAGSNLINSTTNAIGLVFAAARNAINANTGGMVGTQDGGITVTMGIETARSLATAGEIKDYVRLSYGLDQLQHAGQFQDLGGLPPILFGCRVNVLHEVVNTANEGAANAVRNVLTGITTTVGGAAIDDIFVFHPTPYQRTGNRQISSFNTAKGETVAFGAVQGFADIMFDPASLYYELDTRNKRVYVGVDTDYTIQPVSAEALYVVREIRG